MVASVVATASVSWSAKSSSLELQTWVAPSERSRSTCSWRRTTFTSGMSSDAHSFTSIWPRFDAAAVWTSAVWPSSRIVSIMPSVVRGLTKHDAPSAGDTPSGRTRHCSAGARRSSAYIAPPRVATVLPRSAWAASDDPAATTVPAPSLPMGTGTPTRACTIGRKRSGISAVRVRPDPSPDCWAVRMSAGPNIGPRSEGLIGAASTRMTTWSSRGSGRSTSAIDSTTFPSSVTVECSWRAMWVAFRRGADGHCVIRRTAPA